MRNHTRPRLPMLWDPRLPSATTTGPQTLSCCCHRTLDSRCHHHHRNLESLPLWVPRNPGVPPATAMGPRSPSHCWCCGTQMSLLPWVPRDPEQSPSHQHSETQSRVLPTGATRAIKALLGESGCLVVMVLRRDNHRPFMIWICIHQIVIHILYPCPLGVSLLLYAQLLHEALAQSGWYVHIDQWHCTC